MSLFLCCDCGGSKTSVAISDTSGSFIACSTGGPSNFANLGLKNFLKTVKAVVEKALREAGISDPKLGLSSLSASDAVSASARSCATAATAGSGPSATRAQVKLQEQNIQRCLPLKSPYFLAAWFGIAGIDSITAVATLHPSLADLLGFTPADSEALIITNDTALLAAPLVAATALDSCARTAVTVVGGTGSIAASFRISSPLSRPGMIQAEGKTRGPTLCMSIPQELARRGGWGWMLGDEGGGFHVGREAVRALLREHENAIIGGEGMGMRPSLAPTPAPSPASSPSLNSTLPHSLRELIFTHFNVRSAPELLTIIHDVDPDMDLDCGNEEMDTLPPIPVPAHRKIKREKRLSRLAPLVFRAAFGEDCANDDADGDLYPRPVVSYDSPPCHGLNPTPKKCDDTNTMSIRGGGDPLALSILRSEAEALAQLIASLLEPNYVHGDGKEEGTLENGSSAQAKQQNLQLVQPHTSLLIFGGSLVGVSAYRKLVLDALDMLWESRRCPRQFRREGVKDEDKPASVSFASIEYVSDTALAGVNALVAQHAACDSGAGGAIAPYAMLSSN